MGRSRWGSISTNSTGLGREELLRQVTVGLGGNPTATPRLKLEYSVGSLERCVRLIRGGEEETDAKAAEKDAGAKVGMSTKRAARLKVQAGAGTGRGAWAHDKHSVGQAVLRAVYARH